MFLKKILLIVLIICCGSCFLEATPPQQLPALSQQPLIDGLLTDVVWDQAARYSNFKTLKPDFGLPPSEKTIAFLAYDERNLYFAIQCFDREPEKIKATLSARDQNNGDDWVAFCIDADNDEQAAFFFMTNPLGVQADGTLNASADPDILLDMVWESAAQITADGYTVEMAIPFTNLRFPKKDTLVMGFKIARFISRKSEEVDFPEYNPQRGASLTQFQKIVISGIRSGTRLEFLPSLTFSKSDFHREGHMHAGKWQSNIGVTSKIGISSGLTLDLTYNPDFSQVETDASQIDVNLRAALFYPEKRPFFQEGQEWLGFSSRPGGTYLREIVNTRSIVDPLIGAKLSGKIGQKNLLSTLYALDEYPGSIGEEPNNRNAHFSVLRYARLLKDDAYIGLFFTGYNFDRQANYVSGLDGRLRTSNQSRVEFHAYGSFDQKDREKDRGHAFALSWYLNTREWNIRIGVFDLSTDFNTQLGYLTRRGIFSVPLVVSRNFYFKSKSLQRISPYYWSRHSYDHTAKLWETFNVIGLEFSLPKQTEFSSSIWLANELFAGQHFNRNSLNIEIESQPFKWLRFGAEWRYGNGILYDIEAPSSGKEMELGAGIRFQPMQKLSIEMGLSYAQFTKTDATQKLYDVTIWRNTTIYQFNKFLFLRAITQYNNYQKKLRTDLLLSFTWIPGTVVYLGYGSQFDQVEWQQNAYFPSDHFINSQRSWFFKASYRWQK